MYKKGSYRFFNGKKILFVSTVFLLSHVSSSYSQQADSDAVWEAELSEVGPDPAVEMGDKFSLMNQDLGNTLKRVGVGYSRKVEDSQSQKVILQGEGGIKQLRQAIYGELSPQLGLISAPAELKIFTKTIQNQDISFVLESNPATGYRWEFTGADNDIVIQKGRSEYKSTGTHPGGTVKQKLTLRAVNGGNNTINFVYHRPWEASAKSANRLTIQMAELPQVLDLSNPQVTAESDYSQPEESTNEPTNAPLMALTSLPSAWDWRTQGGVTPIRDQGSCGSCWAFGTVGALESALKIRLGLTTDLSEQFLVSCNNRRWSCSGGWWAHDYHGSALGKSQAVAGAVLEAAMPYTATNGTCKTITDHPYHLASWNYVAGNWDTMPSPEQLKTAIYSGPVAASVCVGNAFQDYRSGVFATDERVNCGSGKVNHAVVLVGWNDADQTWILRNSWSTWWGEQGYMRIKWGVSNIGLGATYVSDPYTSPSSDNTFSLTVTKLGTGSGTLTSSPAGIACGSTCSHNYPSGTIVTLTATPAAGSRFAGWSGACYGTLTCRVTISQSREVKATFNKLPSYTLSVSKSGTGSGTVVSSPAGIACGSTCLSSYPSGTVVTLTAVPETGSRFTGWSGSCRGTVTTCRVTVNGTRGVTAKFYRP